MRRIQSYVINLFAATLLAVAAQPASAAAPTIKDGGGLFGPAAITEGNRLIGEAYLGTQPHKDVAVETVAALAPGATVEQAAEAAFSRERLDGLLIYIVKAPHKLAVAVGRRTQERFTGKDQVREAMLARFRSGDYDGGLISGLKLARQGLLDAFPSGVRPSASVHSPSRSPMVAPRRSNAMEEAGGFSWWPVILIGTGIVIVIMLIRRRSGSSSAMTTMGGAGGTSWNQPPGGVPGGGGAFGGNGGGFGRSLLGGAIGAIGGNWLYDRLRGDGGGGHAYGGTERGYDRGGAGEGGGLPAGDDGDVGSVSSGSWDDSGGGSDFDAGGGDSGGDSGGDW